MSNGNSAQNAGATVAALSVERAARALGASARRAGAAGLVVQPALWVATGNGPDAGDTFGYATGVIGTAFGSFIVSVAGIVVGTTKAALDDRTQTLVDAAKRDEPSRYRQSIFPIGDYNFWASNNHTQAITIANAGGVAWRHPNGALCFIRDLKGHVVCDYEPNTWKEIYRPYIPLELAENGRGVRWEHRVRHR